MNKPIHTDDQIRAWLHGITSALEPDEHPAKSTLERFDQHTAIEAAVDVVLAVYDSGGLSSRWDGRLIGAIELLRRTARGAEDEEWAS